MLRPRIHLRWLVLLVSIVAIAGCQSTRPPGEYKGTIYYGDKEGIWEMTLPGKKVSLLTNRQSSSEVGLSPDQKWLLYYDSTSQDKDGRWLFSMWIVSTQGGESTQVSHEVPLIWPGGWRNGWFRYTELSDFQVDPKLGYVMPRQIENYAFNPETREHRIETEATPIPPPPTDEPGSCRKLTFAPSKYDNIVENCVDMNGSAFLRVAGLNGSNPIIVPLAYRDGELSSSSNGRWLAFAGKDLQGTNQVFILDRHDKSVRQITRNDPQDAYGLLDPRWSPDSQWLALSARPNGLCVVKVQNGDLKCFEGYGSGSPVVWSPDSQGILIRSNRIGKPLTETPVSGQICSLFAFRRVTSLESPITRLLNIG